MRRSHLAETFVVSDTSSDDGVGSDDPWESGGSAYSHDDSSRHGWRVGTQNRSTGCHDRSPSRSVRGPRIDHTRTPGKPEPPVLATDMTGQARPHEGDSTCLFGQGLPVDCQIRAGSPVLIHHVPGRLRHRGGPLNPWSATKSSRAGYGLITRRRGRRGRRGTAAGGVRLRGLTSSNRRAFQPSLTVRTASAIAALLSAGVRIA